MRNLILLVKLVVLILFICSCKVDKNRVIVQESSKHNNLRNIKIPKNISNQLQLDSIFDEIIAVPLETNPKSLLKRPEKIEIFGNKIYIRDEMDKVAVFSLEGKFIGNIGKRGRGPGEYLECRDFDIDSNGICYILDFCKILKFDITGKYIGKINFEYSPKTNLICNPLRFSVIDENNFYIWGGSFSINKNNSDKAPCVIYKMDSKGILSYGYIALKFQIMTEPRPFSKFENFVNIDPLIGNDTIYSLCSEKLYARYFVDFGDKALTREIPNNFETIGDFKAEISQDYYFDISDVIETNNWLYFFFFHRNRIYETFFDKRNAKTFVSTPSPRFPNRIQPYFIFGKNGDDFLTISSAWALIEDYKYFNSDTINNIPLYQKKLWNIVKKLNENDNNIVLICKTK